MDHNGLQGGMFSGIGTSGMLSLESPLHQQQNPQNLQSPPPHHPQMLSYSCPSYPTTSNTMPKQQSTLSDEDDPGFAGEDTASDGKMNKISPWQRMKWTDSMVRLLIMAVFYIGDEASSEVVNDPTSAGKKKAGGAGLSQKKGKWKSVSGAMMEKGFYVSPQQCEDKFNDLNKRYKRVNDILGKGTACRVVENQSLLDTMDLDPKMKEEARKLLNSKHLFFREMCAYHNSCGHGPSGVAPNANNQSPEVATTGTSPVQHQQQSTAPLQQQQQQRCSHSENAQFGNPRAEMEALKLAPKRGRHDEDEDDDDADDESAEDEDYDDEDDDEDDGMEGHSMGQNGHGHHAEDEHDGNKPLQKRPRSDLLSLSSSLMQQLNSELMAVMQDGTKSSWEKKRWMKLRLMQLEKQQVSYRSQSLELEKQRLKWLKFNRKKEREMERAKLENERRRLENERMVLLVKQKELELLDLQPQQQHSSNKRGDPSSSTA